MPHIRPGAALAAAAATVAAMALVLGLPPRGMHPEHMDALRRLAKAGLRPGRIHRVYGAGDPLADRDDDGEARDTILFTDIDGEPYTALLIGEAVSCRSGW